MTTLRLLVIAALTAALSLLPPLYLHLIWPTVPTLVATRGIADHFAARQEL